MTQELDLEYHLTPVKSHLNTVDKNKEKALGAMAAKIEERLSSNMYGQDLLLLDGL